MFSDKIAELEAEIHAKETELEELKHTMGAQEQEIEKLGEENRHLSEELATKNDEIDDLINHPHEGNSEELYIF